jgi:hypothetical protein
MDQGKIVIMAAHEPFRFILESNDTDGYFTRRRHTGKELMSRKIKSLFSQIMLALFLFQTIAPAAESAKYRLLSISDSEKLILVSQIPNKKKFLLDASAVKITLNDKALEFKDLKKYSIILAKIELRKKELKGTKVDGIVMEINIQIK